MTIRNYYLSLFSLTLLACTNNDSSILEPDKSDVPACQANDIVDLEVPLGDGSNNSFRYRFRYRKPSAPEMPTIVQIPGGPGSASIGNDTSSWVPEEYGLLQTDPRGVGCNRVMVSNPEELFQSEIFAGDIVTAIDYLELDNYLVFGHSYGTLLGSRVAHEIEARGIDGPVAVILSGVLGRAFGDEEHPGQSGIDLWERLQIQLPSDVLETLSGPRPLGLSPEEWGAFFMGLLPSGLKDGKHPVVITLLEMSEEFAAENGTTVEEGKEGIVEFVLLVADSFQEFTDSTNHMQPYVSCREITTKTPADNVDAIFVDGALVPNPDTGLCSGLSLSNPFDIVDFSYSAPTFYFIGENDSATPTWQGQYHFDNNSKSPRTMLMVPEGGHSPLRGDLDLCSLDLIVAIAEGTTDIEEALFLCDPEVVITSSAAGN